MTLTYKNLIVEFRWIGNNPFLVEQYPQRENNPFIFPVRVDKHGNCEIEGQKVPVPIINKEPLSDEEFTLFARWLKEELISFMDSLEEDDKDELCYRLHKLENFVEPLMLSYLDSKGFVLFTKEEAERFKEDFFKPILIELFKPILESGYQLFKKNGWRDFNFPFYDNRVNRAGIDKDYFPTEERRTPMR